jgi:spore coat polysaccharide biosynthesis protein SpsF
MDAAAPVVLATTGKPEDDALAAVAELYGASVFRGPEDDVLSRFVLAARRVGARYVIRATADNPATDIEGPRRVLAELITSNVDHVIEDELPYGSAVEAVSVAALERASKRAGHADDREHVTSLIRRDRENFTARVIPAPASVRAPDVRLTVDTREDLRYMRALAVRLGGWSHEPALATILKAASAPVEKRCA